MTCFLPSSLLSPSNLEKKRGRVREREGALDAIKVAVFDASNLLARTLGGFFFLSDANARTGASRRKRDDNGWRRARKEAVEKSSA